MPTSSYATDEDLLAYIPELSAIDVALRTLALEDAEQMIDDRWFGDKTRRAHVLLTAHHLAVLTGDASLGGETGPVASMSAGSISASFAVTAPDAGDTGSTRFGRLYLEILKTVPHSGASA